jgi:hypothetical protein
MTSALPWVKLVALAHDSVFRPGEVRLKSTPVLCARVSASMLTFNHSSRVVAVILAWETTRLV